jgi:hypothetical protein
MSDTGLYIAYEHKPLRKSTVELIGAINQIVELYEKKGFTLTVRQIHYQFVQRGWLPNTGKTYNQLQGAINTGRLAGLISWTAIEDRGRSLKGLGHYTSPAEAIDRVRRQYRIDKWANQPFRPEVWVEKQALEGVVGQICNRLEVDFYAQKGYNSTSEHWRAGQRFARYVEKGQCPIVFHLGDHDPSGIHMTESNAEKLTLFAGVPIMVSRLALNMDQIEQYNPPPNPAKDSDSRFEAYRERFGDESWELDALDPEVIQALIKTAVDGIRDEEAWDTMVEQEVEDLRLLEDTIAEMGGKLSEGDAGEDFDI